MKNTIFMQISEFFCPHYCISCAKVGGILCECCKKYIMSEHEEKCLSCGERITNNICARCALPFRRQFYIGVRDGVLKELINIYKYNSVRACGVVFAQMLTGLGDFRNATFIALPTINKHIRERGFDHTKRLVRMVAAMSGARAKDVLNRANSSVQVGASEKKRMEQAKNAYIIKKYLTDVDARYILLDDVWTTGSSMLAACDVLKRNGYKNIDVMVIARSK